MHNVSAGASIAALDSPLIPHPTVVPEIAPRTSRAALPVHALIRPHVHDRW